MAIEKFCTRCGKKFAAIGREVICPSCKAQAAEESKRAAVLKAKRASWSGESVPVRISGRASTVIREFGAANTMPFAAALDALLQETQFVHGMEEMGVKWNDITPYKSRRRDKHATEDAPQDKQDKQDKPQASKPQDKPQEVKTAAKVNKTSTTAKTSKKASSKPSKSVKEG